VKKQLIFVFVSFLMISAVFAPHEEPPTEKGSDPKINSISYEGITFQEICDNLNLMNETGIINKDMFIQDFEENPMMMAFLMMNETITVKVDFNKTECVQFHLIVENETLENMVFGAQNLTGIYIKIDTIFLEEIRQKLFGLDSKNNAEKFFTVLDIAGKFMGAFFNGNLVIKPFSIVFKFFDVLVNIAKTMA